MTKKLQIIYRLAFGFFCLACYFMAAVFAFDDIFDLSAFLPFAAGLVVSIVAGGGLLVAHFWERRSGVELLIAAACPFLVYYLVFSSLDITEQNLWIFCGFSYFLIIVEGFFIGLILSPLAGIRAGLSKQNIIETIKEGLRYIKHADLVFYALVLITGTIFAGIVFSIELFELVGRAGTMQQISFYLFFLAATITIVLYTQRNTVFGSQHRKRSS